MRRAIYNFTKFRLRDIVTARKQFPTFIRAEEKITYIIRARHALFATVTLKIQLPRSLCNAGDVTATLAYVVVFVVSHLGDGLLVAIDRIVAPMGVLGQLSLSLSLSLSLEGGQLCARSINNLTH